jgi:hypothetical protein
MLPPRTANDIKAPPIWQVANRTRVMGRAPVWDVIIVRQVARPIIPSGMIFF